MNLCHTKNCPYCQSNNVVKNGKQSGRQRYKCLNCPKQFQSKKRKDKFRNKLWYEYVWRKQTLAELSKDYHHSIEWVKQQLNQVVVVYQLPKPQPVIIVVDTVFWGRYYGVAIAREPNLKKNLYWLEVRQETAAVYAYIRYQLEKRGFTIKGAVIDGKKGVRQVFFGAPVQLCHFHQLKTIKRYLTSRPKLEAGQELRKIALSLTKTTEDKFKKDLDNWFKKWSKFLKEKTLNPETGRWFYTHKRLRSAYRSLATNLPCLFTHQKYPELDIPNTSNSLEGSFSVLKSRLRVHQGLRKKRRYKMICEILKK